VTLKKGTKELDICFNYFCECNSNLKPTGMLNTPGPDDRASKIRSLAEEEFDTETLQEVAVALATKCKSTKFQFSVGEIVSFFSSSF